jgi:Complex I intermediate-associated protein 30 (CIA30)
VIANQISLDSVTEVILNDHTPIKKSSMTQPPSPIWNINRFLETLDYFDAIPILSDFRRIFFGTPRPMPPKIQANTLFDFSQPTTDTWQTLWGSLDDGVMGGVSASQVQAQPEGLVFTGYVSTANSGGFASIRTRNFEQPLDLSAYTALVLRVKGDGQRYKFFVRDSAAWDSIAYAYSFDTIAHTWLDVTIPFAQLRPVQRARTLSTTALDLTRLYSFQLMLSKFEYDRELNPSFQPGEFKLLVQNICVESL